jgi:glycerol-3-phosphate cytidylyltransferase-like family protein
MAQELYVLVLPDDDVRRNKGQAPANSQNQRINQLLRTGLIQGAFVDSLSLGLKSLELIKPDCFFLGYDQNTKWEDELVANLHARFPACAIRRMEVFANGVHSRHLKS